MRKAPLIVAGCIGLVASCGPVGGWIFEGERRRTEARTSGLLESARQSHLELVSPRLAARQVVKELQNRAVKHGRIVSYRIERSHGYPTVGPIRTEGAVYRSEREYRFTILSFPGKPIVNYAEWQTRE